MNLSNYMDGLSVAYHHESVTRKKDTNDQVNIKKDFENVLVSYIKENFDKLKNYIYEE